jgi:hypothetical protein
MIIKATFTAAPTSGFGPGSFGPSSPYGFNITVGNTYTILDILGAWYLIDDAGQLEQSVLSSTGFSIIGTSPVWTIVSITSIEPVQIWPVTSL